MIIGSFRKDKDNYYIHLEKNNDKFNYYIVCSNNEGVFSLNENQAVCLLKEVFQSEKRFLKKENEYEIYLDEANNKRYYKNGKENLMMFFMNNGQSAILNDKENEKTDDDKFETRLYFFKQGLKFTVVVGSACLLGVIGVHIDDMIKEKIFSYSNEVAINQTVDLSTDDIADYILNSNGKGMTDDYKKKLTSSGKLFSDVMEIADPSRYYALTQKLENINVEYFTEEEKETKENVGGYYNAYKNLNLLHLREKTDYCQNHALYHEFIHLLQDSPNPYYYIIEASAEMMTCEYFGVEASAYPEGRKRLAVLMEIIGPKTIFECNFKGDTSTFEDEIRKNLDKENADNLLELFKKSPAYDENTEQTNKKIDELLAIMYENVYGKKIEDDKLIEYIYNENIDDYNLRRSYFNSNNEGFDNNIISQEIIGVESIDFETYDKEGIEYTYVHSEEISEEEYKKLKGKEVVNFDCELIDGYKVSWGYIEDIDNDQIKYTLEEAIERNIASNPEYTVVRKDKIYSYEEVLKIDKKYKDIRIKTKDGLEGALDESTGKPVFKYVVYDTIEAPSISEKFPEQSKKSNEQVSNNVSAKGM